MGYIVDVGNSPISAEIRRESIRFYTRLAPGQRQHLSCGKTHVFASTKESVELSDEFLVAVIRLIASNPEVAQALREFEEAYNEKQTKHHNHTS